MITLRIGNVFTVVQDADKKTEEKLWDVLSFKIPGAEFSRQYQDHVWDGKRHLYLLKTHRFPTGIISWALPHLDGPKIIDTRTKPPQAFQPHHIRRFDLRGYQAQAVESALRAGRGVIRSATGSGKSVVMAELIARLGVRTLVCVHLTPLLYQLRRELERMLNAGQVGLIGDGYFAPRKVTVAMAQSLNSKLKYPQMRRVLDSVGCWIADECHHSAADMIYGVAQKIPNAYYRFGFSATPWRSDKRDLMIHATTGKRIFDLSASVLIRDGFLARPRVLFYSVPKVSGMGGLNFAACYKYAVVYNRRRNRLIARIVQEMVKQGKTVLVAITQIAHGKELSRLLKRADVKFLFIRGENESKEKSEALRRLNDRTVDCVVATTVFGEGVDVPNLDVLINARANKGSVETLQVAGRALRITPKKKEATIVDFVDNAKYLYEHSKRRYGTYRTEEEFEICYVNREEIVQMMKWTQFPRKIQ